MSYYTPERLEAMWRLYHEQGYTLVEVGKVFHISGPGVWAVFKKYNIPRRGKGKRGCQNPDRLRIMAGMYESGWRQSDIAAQYRISPSCVSMLFKKYGIMTEKRERKAART